jgi:maltooligosyltrehalose trehalohydrolase
MRVYLDQYKLIPENRKGIVFSLTPPNFSGLREQDSEFQAGAFYDGRQSRFCVWAPEKQTVDLILGDRRIPLHKMDHGYWAVSNVNVPSGTRYQFSIDKGEPTPDPASCYQPDGVHGASEVIERAFPWSDNDWRGLPLSSMIIYELHVGTFTAQGNFEGVIDKLPYLRALGINAIELLPVAQFPGERNWGYDGVFPFAVQNSYGGPAGLKRLVNEAHRNGIAVILDVVYNHLGPEGNYLENYGPYFTDKYKTGWGRAINFDDAWCDGVRNYYWQNALMWLKEFHIDGLRLDAVHAIWDFSALHFIDELQKRVEGLKQELSTEKILIAEFDLNNPRYINARSEGGYNLDGQWIDEYHHAVHALITGEQNGYYEDFGKDAHLISALENSYVYTGQFSRHRKKLFGVKPSNPYDKFVVFIQNHDQIGNRLLGDRLSAQLSIEELKLAAATYLLSPHIPMLFMGEEYGEKKPFQYFISHSDKELIAAVREGRKKEFSYFGWKEDIPDPQSEKTFKECVLSWDYETNDKSSYLLDYYKHLIRLRKERNVLRVFDRNSLRVRPSGQENLIMYERTSDDETILVALNFNKHAVSINNPYDHPVTVSFNSSLFVPGEESPQSKVFPGAAIMISPRSAMMIDC